jgi:hypothetical protein
MFSNQTSELSTQPNMRTHLAILQPMLVDDILNLSCPGLIGTQSGQPFCPSIEENGCVQRSELFSDFGGYSGKFGYEV